MNRGREQEGEDNDGDDGDDDDDEKKEGKEMRMSLGNNRPAFAVLVGRLRGYLPDVGIVEEACSLNCRS